LVGSWLLDFKFLIAGLLDCWIDRFLEKKNLVSNSVGFGGFKMNRIVLKYERIK